jgi:hypothetical protein
VTFYALDIPVGHTAALHSPELFVPPPFDFCVVIDPYDEVFELYERTGNFTHTLECPELPDLEVQDAYFEHYVGNRIVVQVQNIGPGDLVDRTLSIEVRTPDGELLFEPTIYSGVSMERWDTQSFRVTPLDGSIRGEMAEGYTVTINQDHAVLERTHDNNSFTVGAATRLSTYLALINVPIPAADIVVLHIDGYILTGRVRDRQVVNLDVSGGGFDWSCDETLNTCHVVFHDYEYWENWFEIYGDEDFEIVINIEHSGTRAGGGSLLDSFTIGNIYEPPTWGAGDIDPVEGLCHYDYSLTDGFRELSVYDWADRRWRVAFNFCRENYGE